MGVARVKTPFPSVCLRVTDGEERRIDFFAMPKSYHEQFRARKKHNGVVSQSKGPAGSQSSARQPAAVVKQSTRSDTFILSRKLDDDDATHTVRLASHAPSQHAPPGSIGARPSPPALTTRDRSKSMRENSVTRTTLKQPRVIIDRTGHGTSSPSVHYQRAEHPLSGVMRTTNYHPSASYPHGDYHHTVSDPPTISYLPPISHPMTHQRGPTIIIRPKDSLQSDVSPYATAPYMYLSSTYPGNTNMLYPSSSMSTSPAYYIPSAGNPSYVSQPFFYPMPYTNPPPPAPAPQSTIVNQSSASATAAASASAAAPVIEQRDATIIVRPHATTYPRKNVTIQLKLPSEVRLCSRSSRLHSSHPIQELPAERMVRVVRDSGHCDQCSVDAEPRRVVYEQPARRRTIVRRAPSTEYVYVDRSPSITRCRHHRSEVVYVDNDDEDDEIEYIYGDGPMYHRTSRGAIEYD